MRLTNEGRGVVVLRVETRVNEYEIEIWPGHSYALKDAIVARVDRDPMHSTAENVRVTVTTS